MGNIKTKFIAESVCVPGDCNVTNVPVPRPMPCVVIFVHGVNSEGEWYNIAENSLVNGINERLGRMDLASNGCKYGDSVRTDRRPLKSLELENSPIIRFYWGYRAAKDETNDAKFPWRIPLKTRVARPEGRRDDPSYTPYSYPSYSYKASVKDIKGSTYYWGGGPFQNGTSALSMSWYDGFNPVVWGINIGSPTINPERNRPLNACPKRTYYVNASKRLAKLIDTIYERYPNDTIAVVSHSQGTMIASLAMFYVEKVPDTLFLCNSPYRLSETVLDDFQMGSQAPTTKARVNTFFNMLDRFKAAQADTPSKVSAEQLVGVGGWFDAAVLAKYENATALSAGVERESVEDDDFFAEEATPVRWSPSIPMEDPVPGKEELSHHNHGRVFVYFSPHDRVMGATPLESIGWKGVDDKLPDPANPKSFAKVEPFDKYRGVLFQRQFMRSHAVGGAPNPKTPRCPSDGEPWNPPSPAILGPVKEHASIARDATVNVNGPAVPRPILAEEMKTFDDDTAKKNNEMLADDNDYLYYEELYMDKPKWVREDAPPYDGSNQVRYRRQIPEEIAEEFRSTIATPTNHSTILMYEQGMLVERVLAYDLPIGRADSFSDRAFWKKLLKMADWLEEDPDYEQGGDYQLAGEPPPGVDCETNGMANERSIYKES
ncbi:T6SS effector phospholipase Tle3 domain-containing protein [Burkholderia ubonensis]